MAIDWTKIYKEYRGLWIALQDDETTVIASGATAKEALNKSKGKGYAQPILARMPNDLSAFIG